MGRLEGGKIGCLQLATLIIGCYLGSSLILNPGQSIGRDAWLAVLAGWGEGLFFVGIVLILAARFKGQTLMQINDLIFGSYLGKVVSLLYLWYFLHLGSLVLRNFGDFFTTTIYTETPIIVFILMLALVCASAVRNGLEVLARCSTILVLLTLLAIVFDTVLLMKDMEFTNFLPMLDIPWPEFLKVSHGVAVFPFGETIAFLMILPFTTEQKKIKITVIMAVMVVGLFLTLVVARNIAVLGATAIIQTYPSFPAIRLVNIAKVLTRLEIIIAANLLFMGFLKTSFFYYSTALGLAQLLRLRSYLPLVLPLGAILVSLSILQFESNVENIRFAFQIYPYYAPFFQVGLPLLSLLIAVIRGLPNKAKGNG
jgi:spore germination protein KB